MKQRTQQVLNLPLFTSIRGGVFRSRGYVNLERLYATFQLPKCTGFEDEEAGVSAVGHSVGQLWKRTEVSCKRLDL